MGYNINVDHSKFEDVSKKIEEYIESQNNYMKSAKEQMNILFESWKATDADALKEKWENIESTGSTTTKMKKSLENYSLALKEAASQYKNAQASAINEANGLPRW